MPRPKPPHLHSERSRHGKLVWYVRRGHKARIRLRAEYDSPEFWQEYREAIEGSAPRTALKPAGPKSGTLAWAIDRYRASAAWSMLARATKRQRELIYSQVTAVSGARAVAKVTPADIVAGRDRRAAKPHSANNFVKSMRAFFAWASDPRAGGLVETDPTKGVALLRTRNPAGYHTWTEDEVARFETHWPLGTRERLALDVLLYTGLRRGDAVRLGRQHVKEGVIYFPATEKTGEPVTIPVLEPLRLSIAATPVRGLTFIETSQGRPWVKESFGTWFKAACVAAGVPGTAHGIRKAGATRAAENGASSHQLMAIFGWTTIKQAEAYTRAADRKRNALAGALTMLPARTANAKSLTMRSGTPAPPLKSRQRKEAGS